MAIYNFTNPYTSNSSNIYDFSDTNIITTLVSEIMNNNNSVIIQSSLSQVITETLKTTTTAIGVQNLLQSIVESVKLNTTSTAILKQIILETVSELLKVQTTQSNKILILQSVSEIIKLLTDNNVSSAGIFIQIISELVKVKGEQQVQIQITQILQELVSFLTQNFIFNASDIYIVCNELLRFKDTIDVTYNVSQIITVMINELFAVYSQLYNFGEFTQNIVDQIFTRDRNNISANFAIALNDSFKLSTSLLSNIDFKLYLEEIIRTSFIINLDGQLYECYCINLENQALTRYDNYEFESFCQYQRNYYGIKKDGIYLLEGKTDNGEDIKSKVKTGYFNIANIQTKGVGFSSLRLSNNRLDSGYAVVKNDGQIIFRIYDDKGKSFDYNLNEVYDNEKFRFQIGQGLKSSMFQLELEATGNFELKDCALIPIVLQRKI